TTTVGNDNVLGTPDQLRAQTVDDADPSHVWVIPGVTPPPYVTAGAFSLTAYQVTNDATGMNGNTTNVNPNGMVLAPGQFLVIGASTNPGAFTADSNTTIPKYLGNGAVAVPTAAMTYTATVDGVTKIFPDQTAGVTVLLRRLANPHLPPQETDPTALNFNPYITVDFMDGVVPNAGVVAGKYQSIGKLQPHA